MKKFLGIFLLSANFLCAGIQLDFTFQDTTTSTNIPDMNQPVEVYSSTAPDTSTLQVLATLTSQDDVQAVVNLAWVVTPPKQSPIETDWDGINLPWDQDVNFYYGTESSFLTLKANQLPQ